MPTPPLTIQLFGPLRVLVLGEPMPRVRTRSVEWLLALLVLRHGRAVDRSWLAGTLWPDSEESQALHNLRDILVHLRKALGPERDRLQSPTRDTLTLDLAGAEIDVVRFDRAIQTGEPEALRCAVEAYSGPLLEGCFEEWVGSERHLREQACLRVLEALAEEAEERQDYAAALGLLRRAEGMDALRDTTRRALMRVLAAFDDTPAALNVYREYRVLLHEAMNVEPDEETVALYQQIRQQARQAAQRGDPTMPEARPSHASSPITPSLPSSVPSALPHPLTALIGREQETREITEAISRSRLITLVGGGGVGKTRLAIQVAGELASDFAGGVAFVGLASLSNPELLPAFVATALGIREEAIPEPAFLLRALTGWFATHNVLLVLDNCEHLIDAAASLTQTLLERCPDLRILATSRQRLGLIGEIAWRVPSLPAPDPERLLEGAHNVAEAVMEYPAVQLFVERAAMARRGFLLADPEEAMAVARICHRLDGIPLAIELAAARVGILSVGQITARLNDRFCLLSGGSRPALPRQKTLKSLIDWSYDLLEEEERTLLCQLSVFAGGWTLQAAEAVTGNVAPTAHSDTLDTLATLIDKSLVVSEEGKADNRYRMLETMREYAREKLRESERERATRDQHLAYYLARAQASTQALAGSDSEPAVGFLEADVDNLRAALAWAQAQAKASTSPHYLQLATALWPFWEVRGYLAEGRAHLRSALNLTDSSDTPLRAQALLGATRLAIVQGDVDEALVFGQECLERFQKQKDARGMAEALLRLGEARLVRWDYDRAVPLLTEALEYSRQSAWLSGTVLATLRLGQVHMDRREMVRGRSFLEEGVARAESLGNSHLLAIAYHYLVLLETTEGNHARARTLLEKELELRIRLGDRLGIAYVFGCLGELERQGDRAQALTYWQQEMAIYRDLGTAAEMLHVLYRMGNLHYQQGDYEPARQVYAEGLEISMSLQDESYFTYFRMNLGSALFHLGDPIRAMELYREALALYQTTQNREGMVWALERLGVVEAMHGDYQKAARLLGAASILREGLGIPLSPFDKRDWEKALDKLRATRSETAFAEAFEAGRAITIEQAIQTALAKASA